MMNFEMTDCNVSTPDDDEPFPITGSGDDAEWIEPIPPKRDLLTYAQARKEWKYDDATLAGLINASRISAFKEENGQLIPFNWLGMRADGNWRTQLPTLLLKPVPDFELESETRYLDYPSALALLKKHNPKFDAAAMLEQETITAAGELNWSLLAISLTGGELTPDSLKDSLYIGIQVQSLIDRIKVKKEPTRKNGVYKLTTKQIEDYHRAGLTQEEIKALGVRLCRVRKVTAGMKHCQRGTKPK